MITLLKRKFPLIVLYAVIMHVVWGTCALIDSSAYNATAFSGIYNVFGDLSPYLCFGVAASAMVALFIPSMLFSFILMMPQQCLFFFSAFAALHGMIDAHFADGVIRSREFIVSDQIPALLGAVAHTLAMVRIVLDQ